MTDKPWSERIPAAIADGEKLLDGDKYVLLPPHMWGNDTKLTIVLTAGEVEMAEAAYDFWRWIRNELPNAEYGPDAPGTEPPQVLREFTEKLERLDHD